EMSLEVTGDERVLKVGGEVRSRSRFKLDPSQTPKAIDVFAAAGTKPRPGIYKVDRDLQVICLGEKDGERPKEFSAAAGANPTLMVFRRPGSTAAIPDFKVEVKVAAPELRKELLGRVKGDQEFRVRLDKYFKKGPDHLTEDEKKEVKALTEKGREVD